MFLNVQEIRDKFNIQPNAFASQIESAIQSAARKIRLWVGADAYDEAISETVPVEPEDLLRYETVLDAHSWLTMYYLSLAVGSKYAGDGVVEQAQDAGSPAMQGNVLTNRYLTPEKLAQNEKKYYETARDAVEPYLVTVDSVTVTATALPQSVRVVSDW